MSGLRLGETDPRAALLLFTLRVNPYFGEFFLALMKISMRWIKILEGEKISS